MPILFYLILGAATAYLAARAMGFRSDPVTVLALGGLGALLGVMAVRLLATLFHAGALLAAAMLGAVAAVWLWRVLVEKR